MKDQPSARDRYDVLICGGGPAGTATALALKRRSPDLRVALVEKSDYAAVRIGESLPPPAQLLLTKLGVWEAFLSRAPLESSGTRAAWGSPSFHENEFIYSPFGRGWHLDRRDFDAMLANEAENAGVTVFRRTQAQPMVSTNGWTLNLRSAGDGSSDRAVSARFVVDATGRRSAFAVSQGAMRVVFDQLVGMIVFVRFATEDRPPDTYTSVEACEQGWWYSAALPNGDVAVIFMTDAGALRVRSWRSLDRWRELLAAAPHTSRRMAAGVPLGDPVVRPAASQRLDSCVGSGWLAVGDAACTWDPLSSQGIMKGLQHGISAARAICRHLAGEPGALDAYDRQIAQDYTHYLHGRAAYYAEEQRWPQADFWRSRHETITLHPEEPLCVAAPSGGPGPSRLSWGISPDDLVTLRDVCPEPRPAHQILAAIKARRHHAHRSDREILLAMQAMIARGVLVKS